MYYPTRYSSYNPVYPIYADELYHHGIKGQRWGHRNGPPYPLNAQTHAAVVRSAGAGDGEKRGRIGSASGKKGGSFFQYNRNTGLATDPMGRWQQRHGYRDADSLYTKKGKRTWAALGAASGAAYGLAGAATASKLMPGNKKTKAAMLAGATLAGAAAGGLGGRLGAGWSNFKRKNIYGPINKAIIGGNKKGHVGSSNAISDAEKKAKRKKMLRNVALGAGGAAALAGGAYALHRKGLLNKNAIANAKKAIGDRAYVEKEIAKTRLGNARKAIGDRAYVEKEIAKTRLRKGAYKAYSSAGRAVNAVRRSTSVGRRAAGRASQYAKNAVANRYGWNATNQLVKSGKLAGAGLGLIAADRAYVHAKKKRNRRR